NSRGPVRGWVAELCRPAASANRRHSRTHKRPALGRPSRRARAFSFGDPHANQGQVKDRFKPSTRGPAKLCPPRNRWTEISSARREPQKRKLERQTQTLRRKGGLPLLSQL